MSTTGSNVFITGANSGIGLALVEHLAKLFDVKNIFAGTHCDARSKDSVFTQLPDVLAFNVLATCPELAKAQKSPRFIDNELAELAKKYPVVKVISLEVLKDESIKAAVEQVQKTLKGEGLHLLINHASVFEQENATYATPKRAVVLKHFEVNTVGALMVTSALLPLLRKAAEKNEPARIVNMSPTISSISNNFGTMPWTKGNVAYGMSKAALNHLTRSIAGQEKDSGIVVVSLSPGWVKTSISGGSDAQTPITESAASIVKTVSLLTRADTGRYIDRNGTPINF